MTMGNKKKKENELLIDRLQKAVKDLGLSFERDGWTEIDGDRCAWLDIHLGWKDNKRLEVHFYFDKNAKRLTEVSVWERERSMVEGEAVRVSAADDDYEFENQLLAC